MKRSVAPLCLFVLLLGNLASAWGADANQDLHAAITRGDLRAVQTALSQGADINATLPNGATPLILAANLGHTSIAEALLTRGADVNAAMSSGYTALFYAVGRENLPLVRALLSRKANTDITGGPRDDMPLRYAIQSGNAEMVEVLVKAGAPVDRPLSENWYLPALHYAVWLGNFDMVNLLLKLGVPIDQRDWTQRTPLMRAAEKNLPKLVLLLLSKGADQNAVCNDEEEKVSERNALCCAAAEGAAGAVKVLLKRGLDPHWQNDRAMRLAEAGGHHDVLSLLKTPPSALTAAQSQTSKEPDAVFPPSTGQITVAISSFRAEENSWKSSQRAADFSTAMQPLLGDIPGATWVERDAIHHAERELGLQAFGATDANSALRLGKWLNAQLLITGTFSADEGEGSRLTIEVVDLQRGDVLARRTRIIRMPMEQRFAFSPADVQETVPMARAALAEAMRALQAVKKQVLVAPLFFRNVSSGTDRLDFAEDELLNAFAQAGNSKVRVVQFPRVSRAAGEAELVLSGLVEVNAEAWKRVADYYIWGEYEEEEVSGLAFDAVPVRFKLHVWDGASMPSEQSLTCRVGEFRDAIPRWVNTVLAGLQSKPASPPSDTVREELARSLHRRVQEVQASDTDANFIEASQRTAGWLHRWRLRLGLLELAHFLAPGDGAIHCDLIVNRWDEKAVFHQDRYKAGAAQFWATWHRNGDWRAHVDRFGFSFLNALPKDTVTLNRLPSLLSLSGATAKFSRQDYYVEMPGELLRKLEVLGGYPDETPRSVHRQWLGQLAKDRAFRLTKVANECPQGLTIWPAIILEDLPMIQDSGVKADIAVAMWKIYAHAPVEQRSRLAEAKAVVETCLRQAGREQEIAPLFVTYSMDAVPEPPPAARDPIRPVSEDLDAWRKTLQERAQKQIADTGASPSEVKTSFAPIKLEDEFYSTSRLTTLAFFDGRLLLGTRGHAEASNRGGYVSWSFDPVSKRLAIIPGLECPDMQELTTFEPAQKSMWVTSDGGGVMRYDPKSGSVEKFSARDGLPTQHMRACAASGALVFCGGGTNGKGHLAVFDTQAQKWSTLLRDGGQAFQEIEDLASSKNWLLVLEEGQAKLQFFLYNVLDRKWVQISDAVRSPLMDGTYANTSVGPNALCTGDDRGFWIAGGPLFCVYDPQTHKTEVLSPAGRPIEGVITSMANDGDWLWIASSTVQRLDSLRTQATSQIHVIHKPTRKLVGHVIVPYNSTVNAMAFSADTGWLALNTRFDNEELLVQLDKKPFLSVPQAQWQPLTVHRGTDR